MAIRTADAGASEAQPSSGIAVAYVLDPVGTTYLLPNGDIYRIDSYDSDYSATPEVEDEIVPLFSVLTRRGGASCMSGHPAPQGPLGFPEGTVRIVLPVDADRTTARTEGSDSCRSALSSTQRRHVASPGLHT